MPTHRPLTAILAALVVAAGLLTGPPTPARAAVGLPPVPETWPSSRLELGLADAPGGAAALRASAAFGFRYQYLAGRREHGQRLGHLEHERRSSCRTTSPTRWPTGSTPVFPYYMLLQSNPATGADEAAKDLSNLANHTDHGRLLHRPAAVLRPSRGTRPRSSSTSSPTCGATSSRTPRDRRRDERPGLGRELRRRRPDRPAEQRRRLRPGDRPAARRARPERDPGLSPVGLGHEPRHQLLERLRPAGRCPRGAGSGLLPLARRVVRRRVHRHRRSRRRLQETATTATAGRPGGTPPTSPATPGSSRGFVAATGKRDGRLADPARQHEDARPGRHVGPLPGQPGRVVPRRSGRHATSRCGATRAWSRCSVRRRRGRDHLRLRRDRRRRHEPDARSTATPGPRSRPTTTAATSTSAPPPTTRAADSRSGAGPTRRRHRRPSRSGPRAGRPSRRPSIRGHPVALTIRIRPASRSGRASKSTCMTRPTTASTATSTAPTRSSPARPPRTTRGSRCRRRAARHVHGPDPDHLADGHAPGVEREGPDVQGAHEVEPGDPPCRGPRLGRLPTCRAAIIGRTGGWRSER